jgi:hypothetical protein
MPRFIMIDSDSGYVFGDSADINGRILPCTNPIEACEGLDHSIGEYGRTYIEHYPDSDAARRGANGYFVYRADINGSEAIGLIHDGQSRETIEAVQRDCRLVAFVETRREARD